MVAAAERILSDTTFAYLPQDVIEKQRTDESGDTARLKTYREYAAGKHHDTLSIDQSRLIGRIDDHVTADNVIKLILNTAASRLRLERFTVASAENSENPDTSKAATDLKDFFTRFWMINRLDRLQFESHFAFLRDGNSAISMSWRKTGDRTGDVRIAREPWWDGESGVFIAYGVDGEESWAVKEFEDADPTNLKLTIKRRTVYYPDRIARYVQRGSGWQEFATDNQPAIVPWVRPDGRPLGIPIVHFPNGASVTDTPYGLSDVVGLIGLQDDLNRTQHDMSAAAQFSGFQQVYGTGVTNGKQYFVTPGGFLWSDNENARFGVIPPGDMSQLSKVHEYKRQTMATDSSTPLISITGQWPSGAALLQADAPTIDKATRLASVAGPQWTRVAHQATEIANAFGATALNEDLPITAIFSAPERIDEATELDLQLKKAQIWDIVSRLPKTAMVKTGLVTAPEADQIIAQRESIVAAFGTSPDQSSGF